MPECLFVVAPVEQHCVSIKFLEPLSSFEFGGETLLEQLLSLGDSKLVLHVSSKLVCLCLPGTFLLNFQSFLSLLHPLYLLLGLVYFSCANTESADQDSWVDCKDNRADNHATDPS